MASPILSNGRDAGGGHSGDKRTEGSQGGDSRAGGQMGNETSHFVLLEGVSARDWLDCSRQSLVNQVKKISTFYANLYA
jgi:hypothetical protein